jgi:hypothetical protein
MRYVNLFVVTLLLAGCNLTPLKIDPCTIMPELATCYAVPLNQPEKPEYERPLNPGDICVTSDEYAAIQKSYRELLKRCGDRCK